MRQERQDFRPDHQPLFRLTRLGLVAIAAGALMVGACAKKPLTRAECSAMLDHYVALLVKSERPNANSDELLRLQAEARHEAASDPNFASCSSQVSRSAWQCAMHADSPDQLEKCLL